MNDVSQTESSGQDGLTLADIQDRSYEHAGKGIRASWPAESAMDAAGIERFLSANDYAVVATTRPDGRPQAAPLSYFVHEGCFWFATVGGQRLRNLEAMAHLALVISSGNGDDHSALIAEGPVEVLPASPELKARWAARHGDDPIWAKAMIRMIPERLFTYDGANA